ncbi:tRNA (adenosine(37)-N6)-threonylcarbamoyltransferase complex transferase subunit TsaD [Elusimicrobiota bacterium]
MRSKKPIHILGIETSCDETAIGIVDASRMSLLSHAVASQIPLHAPYFGVVPELASRAHLEKIHDTLELCFRKAHLKPGKLAGVAYTQGPGLKGSLLVGEAVAKSLAWSINAPLIPINHLEAHFAGVCIDDPGFKPPFIGLLVSGGHTDLILVKKWGECRIIGRTLDDACGEALDKFSKMLRLTYPGGPVIEKLARKGNPKKITFPRPFLPGSWNFSFSGLKTSALYRIQSGKRFKKTDIAASFQEAIFDTLLFKARRAILKYKLNRLVIAGGVASNSRLRQVFTDAAAKEGWQVFYPAKRFSTDNGAMIAMMGALKYRARKVKRLPLTAGPADSTLSF